MTTTQRLEVLNEVAVTLEDTIDVNHTIRIYETISDILGGKKTGVEVALQDGLSGEVYSSSLIISRAYP